MLQALSTAILRDADYDIGYGEMVDDIAAGYGFYLVYDD
jgi:hypothetical protein